MRKKGGYPCPNKLYEQIAERTNGDVYIGVVGPVRVGKSTFVKRVMELVVIPNMQDEAERLRAQDELPQSSPGTCHYDSRTKICTCTRYKYSSRGRTITFTNSLSGLCRLYD